MKFILNTTFSSNEYLDGTTFTLVGLSADEGRRLLSIRQKVLAFMESEGCSSVSLDFPGVMTVFDDSDEGMDALTPLADDGSYVRVADDFEIPSGCDQARIEWESLSVHRNGDLWLKTISKYTSDYVETELPLELIEQAAQ
jgi:hypothetical protein